MTITDYITAAERTGRSWYYKHIETALLVVIDLALLYYGFIVLTDQIIAGNL